jgi:xanthine dehydrogenase molybdopterin-binding subunit B
MAACEHVMEHIASVCNVYVEDLRRVNMYKTGDCTQFGSLIGEPSSGKWNVPTMFDRLYKGLNIPQRRAEFDEFNSRNKWLKVSMQDYARMCNLPHRCFLFSFIN